jgi:hypothetical protein
MSNYQNSKSNKKRVWSFENWNLGIIWYLGFGYWDFCADEPCKKEFENSTLDTRGKKG